MHGAKQTPFLLPTLQNTSHVYAVFGISSQFKEYFGLKPTYIYDIWAFLEIRIVSHMEFNINTFLIVQRNLFMMCLERGFDVQEKVESTVLQWGSGLGRARRNCFTCRQDTSMLLHSGPNPHLQEISWNGCFKQAGSRHTTGRTVFHLQNSFMARNNLMHITVLTSYSSIRWQVGLKLYRFCHSKWSCLLRNADVVLKV